MPRHSSGRSSPRRTRPNPVLSLLVGVVLLGALVLLWFQTQGVFLEGGTGREESGWAEPAGKEAPATSAPAEPFHFAPPPEGYTALMLTGPPARVYDGDTFDADLDGDGRLERPRESVRLLFVDTPELKTSGNKSADPERALPARDFLAAWLAEGPVRLLVPRKEPRGKYGRTLALVETPRGLVNLELVRAGHSPFDTRFNLPGDFTRWRRAEGEAFDAGRGIWGDPTSKEAYLERQEKVQSTPAARSNPRYRAAMYEAMAFEPATLLGTYIHLEGRLTAVEQRSRGVRILRLERGRGKAPFPAVLYRRRAEELGVDGWKPGWTVHLEGFVDTYRGTLQLRVHYAKRVN